MGKGERYGRTEENDVAKNSWIFSQIILTDILEAAKEDSSALDMFEWSVFAREALSSSFVIIERLKWRF